MNAWTHEVTRCKQSQRECAGKDSMLSLPQLTCALSKAQQSFTSLINHMNRSYTPLTWQKFVHEASKNFQCRKNPIFRTVLVWLNTVEYSIRIYVEYSHKYQQSLCYYYKLYLFSYLLKSVFESEMYLLHLNAVMKWGWASQTESKGWKLCTGYMSDLISL